MMPNSDDIPIKSLNERLAKLVARRSRKASVASIWIKILFAVVPGGLLAFLQFANPSLADGNYSAAQIVGMCAAVVVTVSGLWSAYADFGLEGDITVAAEAAQIAQSLANHLPQVPILQRVLDQHRAVGDAVRLMSGIVERGIDTRQDFDAQATGILKVTRRQFGFALDRTPEQMWSLQVYRVQSNSDGVKRMVCVAQSRSIDCRLDETRQFKPGYGVPGIVLATGFEKVVPDLRNSGSGNGFELPQDMTKATDINIRSIACVPIITGAGKLLWGSVCAVSDIPNHFANEGPGVRRVDALRILAGMLAIVAMETQNRPNSGSGSL